jgi:hypothetical protein
MNMSRLLVVGSVLILGWIAMQFWGTGPGEAGGQPMDKVPFAGDRVPAEKAKPVPFNAKRAMGYLEAICAIGPRMSGTGGMKKQQELIQAHFEKLGAKVVFQTFKAKQRSQPKEIEMANIIVSWHPDRQKRVILCSHYDTRPIADREPDKRKWREKFLSANDGGSGVALLMELANHMKDLKTPVGVDFVFFDGEEWVFNQTDKYFFGSEYFAKTWKATKDRPDYKAAILLDMIAGENLRLPAEGTSWFRARPLVQEIWTLAGELRSSAFINKVGDRVMDDHLALQNVGIPAIDLIDFEYPHWHRLSDVPENCSGESMEQVARVLAVWLQRMK